MLLLIDNYDSFTYNLVHYFGELGADVTVHRNDAAGCASGDGAEPVGDRAVPPVRATRTKRAFACR